jgi:hypothetical protein
MEYVEILQTDVLHENGVILQTQLQSINGNVKELTEEEILVLVHHQNHTVEME